jgi:hypothetical protein
MRKLALLSMGAVILCLAVRSASAQEPNQQQGQEMAQQQNVPAAAKVIVMDPNRQPEPNERAAIAKRQEQLRQMARERIRERARERSRLADRTGYGRTADVNARQGAKGQMKTTEGQTPAEKAIAEGAQHQQQLTAIEQQLSYEQDKHLDRIARLKRIHELAQQQGDTETLARVDKLIGQEQRLYDLKAQRMMRRKERIVEFSERAGKRQIVTDANKGGGKPPVENK